MDAAVVAKGGMFRQNSIHSGGICMWRAHKNGQLE